MARLFEIVDAQQRPLTLADRDGQTVLLLRRGTPVSDQLIDQLNKLLADYHEPGRHDIAAWLGSFVQSCLRANPDQPPPA